MSPRFLVVGEALVDVFADGGDPGGPSRELPGGGPANIAVTLGRLGRDVTLATTLGDDERGAAVLAWLAASSVTAEVTRPVGGRTSTARATLDPTGAATYDFDLTWDLPAAPDTPADVVHVGSLGAALEPGARAVHDLASGRAGSALVSFDPNVRPAVTPDRTDLAERVTALVAVADVVKASDEDLAWLHPDAAPSATAAGWAASGPRLVVVTRGARGALLLRPDGTVLDVPGRAVEVVDTVGAGDTFSGALLDALAGLGANGPGARARLDALTDDELVAAAQRAVAAAAITVSRAGADPPTRAELEALLSG